MAESQKAEGSKDKNKANQNETQAAGSVVTPSSLDKFWSDFRLSPLKWEHDTLTNSRSLALIVLAPLLLLIVFSFTSATVLYPPNIAKVNFNYGGYQYSMSRSQLILGTTFRDLNDPIFTYLTLALLFAAFIYCYLWYPGIRKAFQSIFENKILHDQEGNPISESNLLAYLEEYNQKLHSRKRYIFISVIAILFLGTSLAITFIEGYWNSPYLLFRIYLIPRWVIAPILWSFIGGLALWTIFVTARVLMGLTPRFEVVMQPLRSDRAGGLSFLGALSSNVGLMLLVLAIPLSALAYLGTRQLAQVRLCRTDLEVYISSPDESVLTQDRLAECMFYADGGFYNIAIPKASITQKRLIIEAILLTENGDFARAVSEYYEKNSDRFQDEFHRKDRNVFYAIDVAVFVIIVFAFFIVFRPLWDIHNSMVAYKQKIEIDVNNRISRYDVELRKSIQEDKLDDAIKLKPKIKLLAEELDEINKYPRWPISFPSVLQTYLTSGLLSSILTIIFSILSFSPNNEISGFIIELIKSLFGIL